MFLEDEGARFESQENTHHARETKNGKEEQQI